MYTGHYFRQYAHVYYRVVNNTKLVFSGGDFVDKF